MKTKLFQVFLLLVFMLIAPNAFSENTSPTDINGQAVEISIGSIGGEMDKRAYRKLRKLLGEAVGKDVIDKFVVYSYGIEGGFSGCVEAPPGRANPSPSFDKFVSKLNDIKPKEGTVFSTNRTKTCDLAKIVNNQSSLMPKASCTTEWHGGNQYKCCTGRIPRCRLYE